MKNFTPSNLDSLGVLREAIERKGILLRNSLQNIYPTIEQQYSQYDDYFTRNQLQLLVTRPFYNEDTRNHMSGLYSAKSKAVNNIRENILSLQPREISRVCPYCTLDSIADMDHIVPHAEFPEFAIHSKNLIPSCARCNRFKGDRWRNGTVRTTLNLYCDLLPTNPFLFARIFTDNYQNVDLEFYLENLHDIDLQTWDLIVSHFTVFHLLQRFRDKSIQVLTDLLFSAGRQIQGGAVTKEQYIETVIEEAQHSRLVYGSNYWRSVVQEALVYSDDFWNAL